MKKRGDIIANGAIAMQGNRIVALGSSKEILDTYSPIKLIDAKNKIIMPGLINAHTYAGMALMRNLVNDLTLQDWLKKLWIVEEKCVDPDFTYWGTKLVCFEMVRGRWNFFIEH